MAECKDLHRSRRNGRRSCFPGRDPSPGGHSAHSSPQNLAHFPPLPEIRIEIFVWLAPALTYSPAALHSQLELSNTLPLSLKLFFAAQNHTELMHLLTLFSLLLRHSQRWDSLLIGTYEDDAAFHAIQEARHRLDKLRYLEVKAWVSPWSNDLSHVFSETPNLMEVHFLQPAFTSASPRIHLPWLQLTCLHLVAARDSALGQAENLVELVYYDASPSELSTDTCHVVVLPRLHRLSLLAGDEITNSLFAPRLRDLAVTFAAGNIPRFLYRSACNLSRLSLISPSTAVLILQVVQQTGRLSQLRLALNADSDHEACVPAYNTFLTELFLSMTLTGGTSNLFMSTPPRNRHPDFDEAFYHMLTSQWNSQPPNVHSLRCVQTKAPLSVWSSIWQRLKVLRLDGLHSTKPIWSPEEDEKWEAHMADEGRMAFAD
ncbi:hypothetical protein R3P38DRAFT_2759639 [Favolaschia claudopus]|uniref:Uncharacterized protein n=1 Tax=Favolaschia claudopus TaxID=2862362 RepID=A0AAW0DYE6_9AGAR